MINSGAGFAPGEADVGRNNMKTTTGHLACWLILCTSVSASDIQRPPEGVDIKLLSMTTSDYVYAWVGQGDSIECPARPSGAQLSLMALDKESVLDKPLSLAGQEYQGCKTAHSSNDTILLLQCSVLNNTEGSKECPLGGFGLFRKNPDRTENTYWPVYFGAGDAGCLFLKIGDDSAKVRAKSIELPPHSSAILTFGFIVSRTGTYDRVIYDSFQAKRAQAGRRD